MSPFRFSFIRIAVLVLCAAVLAPAALQAQSKKLVEFGWDAPDTRYLRTHLASIEKLPFDGCVFWVRYNLPDGTELFGDDGSFLHAAWGRRAFSWNELSRAKEDLETVAQSRLKENFLRIDLRPGDVDWFEDFSAILNNLELAARLAKIGGARGVLFDTEQYAGAVFKYQSRPQAGTRTFGEYSEQVTRRGREVIEALQRGYPGLTVFMTYGYSMPLRQTGGNAEALKITSYGLLKPFLDGMLQGASGGTRFVDGYEFSYRFKDASQFTAAREQVRAGAVAMAANAQIVRDRMELGFGVWLDAAEHGQHWDALDPSRNFFTPESFKSTIEHALQASDRYVWIYSQEPRWWGPTGEPSKVPPAYLDALRAVAPREKAERPREQQRELEGRR